MHEIAPSIQCDSLCATSYDGNAPVHLESGAPIIFNRKLCATNTGYRNEGDPLITDDASYICPYDDYYNINIYEPVSHGLFNSMKDWHVAITDASVSAGSIIDYVPKFATSALIYATHAPDSITGRLYSFLISFRNQYSTEGDFFRGYAYTSGSSGTWVQIKVEYSNGNQYNHVIKCVEGYSGGTRFAPRFTVYYQY